MEKDLIIGAASGYDWNTLKYWVNSIKRSDFTGDIVVVGSNMTQETMDKLLSEGVKLAMYKSAGQVAPHVERFFYIWNTLDQIEAEDHYNNVIVTDTRDVVFQTNPSDWLIKSPSYDYLVTSSEGMFYRDEPWGYQNIHQTFGPFFAEKMKENLIYNVGVIAGPPDLIKSLMLMIFQLAINRPIPIVDQAVFNFIIHQEPLRSHVYSTNNEDGWAIQLGTTEEAVKAGKGDLGRSGNLDAYYAAYQDWQPVFRDGYVFANEPVEPSEDYKPFCIIHQWDRIPALKEKIEKLYGDQQ